MELYIHIPFCVKKCAYCDFLSAPADTAVRERYVRRLEEEIAFYGKRFQRKMVKTVFFGGGTPTILSGSQLAELLETLRRNFQIVPDAEISIEANPGTIGKGKADTLIAAGANRLSLGLQSADNRELKLLGRIHTFEDFLQSFEEARKAGFQNINVDLMSALPGQRLHSWEKTLKKVLALHPEHISAYSLMIEEGTPFYDFFHEDELRRERGETCGLLPSEEEERRMYARTAELLSGHGYERYEISNYARHGFACRHNVGYWTGEEYLGLGLGASSFVDGNRFKNTADLREYLEKPFSHHEIQKIDRKMAMEEYMFLGLRLMCGVTRTDFMKRFEVPPEAVYGSVLDTLKKEGLLLVAEGRIALTERGIDVSNYVLAQFLLD